MRLRKFFCCVLFLALVFAFIGSAIADVRVRGYTRRDGTYVAPHYRSSPNSTKMDNWSTRGNVNPYTGREGIRMDYGTGYDDDYGY
jgi:hypothetical protein